MSAVLEEVQAAEVPHALSVTIPVKDSMTAGIKTVGAVVEAAEWVIDSPAMAQLAAEQRTAWAKRIDQVKEMQADFMEPAKTFMASVKASCQRWFGPALQDMESGREILGQKLLAWDQQEKARIEAERRRLEDEARKVRQEAEAKAAAERARAEEQAREARRKEAEAQEAQRKAIAEGNARAAAAAAAEAAKQAEKAVAVVETAEAKAQQVELTAAAQVCAAPTPVAVKIAGSSVKENWCAVLADGFTEEKALAAIVQAIVTENRVDLLALLKLDTAPRGALNKLAAAQKKVMRVPGYVARDVPTLAGSRK